MRERERKKNTQKHGKYERGKGKDSESGDAKHMAVKLAEMRILFCIYFNL